MAEPKNQMMVKKNGIKNTEIKAKGHMWKMIPPLKRSKPKKGIQI